MLYLALLAAVLAVAPAPAAPPAAGATPSIYGITTWQGAHGTLQVGAAIPLAAWPSLFGKLGQGELAALVSKEEMGLALGHRFRAVNLEMGRVSMGAAVGIAGVVPFSQPCAGRACRTGLRAVRPVLFVTLPLAPSGGPR